MTREEKQGNEEKFSGFIQGSVPSGASGGKFEASGGKNISKMALMAVRPAGNSTVLHLKGLKAWEFQETVGGQGGPRPVKQQQSFGGCAGAGRP